MIVKNFCVPLMLSVIFCVAQRLKLVENCLFSSEPLFVSIRNKTASDCVNTAAIFFVLTYPALQDLILTWKEDIRPGRDMDSARKMCVDGQSLNKPLLVWDCHGQYGNQLWKYRVSFPTALLLATSVCQRNRSLDFSEWTIVIRENFPRLSRQR